jgi:hypothetical protein
LRKIHVYEPENIKRDCPRSSRYHLVHKLEGRAAIYVSKRFDIKQWDSESAEN